VATLPHLKVRQSREKSDGERVHRTPNVDREAIKVDTVR
jgi:hypothetical protein